MTNNSIKNWSYTISFIFHALLLVLFLIINFNINYPPQKYVELSFGTTGLPGSSGALGNQINNVQQVAKQQKKTETTPKKEVVKKVELPKTKSESSDNIIQPAQVKKAKANTEKNNNEAVNSDVNSEGKGNKATGTGSFGYDIDWGGQGQRKIYSYILPTYPEGVNKEIDIRLKFSIMPDGTVGQIIPLIKADTRLETAAINSLRQWRFEPLSANQKQVAQIAVIVFPYRLQ
jgi:protein TonB